MCFKKLGYMAVLVVAAARGAAVSAAEEPNWAQQLVGPVEGTSVHHNETTDFGRYKFVTGPEAGGVIAKTVSIEGKESRILYQAPGKSSFGVYSVYKKFFAEKGYETLFACEGKACGEKFRGTWYDLNPFQSDYGWNNSAPITQGSWESQFYIAARKKSAAGDIYAAVFTNAGRWSYPVYRVDVAQVGGLQAQVVPASRIAEALNADGRIAFYGITFDTGSSAIKAGSEPTLAEIGAFLRTAAGSAFYVVGHTDDEGALEANMKLSRERAEAIAKYLADKHGVSASSLSPYGAGPLSPVAANSTTEGRALNRRVEIVKRLPAASRSAGSAPVDGVPDFNIKQDAVQAAQGTTPSQPAAPVMQAAPAVQVPQEPLVVVPDVMGKLFLVGKDILVKQGFKVVQTGKNVGFVRGQSPSAGNSVKKGSTVTLKIGY